MSQPIADGKITAPRNHYTKITIELIFASDEVLAFNARDTSRALAANVLLSSGGTPNDAIRFLIGGALSAVAANQAPSGVLCMEAAAALLRDVVVSQLQGVVQ